MFSTFDENIELLCVWWLPSSMSWTSTIKFSLSSRYFILQDRAYPSLKWWTFDRVYKLLQQTLSVHSTLNNFSNETMAWIDNKMCGSNIVCCYQLNSCICIYICLFTRRHPLPPDDGHNKPSAITRHQSSPARSNSNQPATATKRSSNTNLIPDGMFCCLSEGEWWCAQSISNPRTHRALATETITGPDKVDTVVVVVRRNECITRLKSKCW